jgi:hypothetical protein
MMGRYNRTTQERLDEHTDNSGDCWIWTGSRHRQGYGRIRVDDKLRLSHVVTYELIHGPIPLGMKVCHTCDNPPCRRPSHLFLGTQRDNIIDAVRKGRLNNYRKGPEHHYSLRSCCKHGHAYTADNTRVHNGARICRTCERGRKPVA